MPNTIQVIEAVNDTKAAYENTVFLAGGITNCRSWQTEIIEKLKDVPITVFNPRRKNFPINDPTASKAQIEWEFRKLREAQLVSFWFCAETLCPIVLFELGAAMERTTNCIIGMDKEYARRKDVEIQAELKGHRVFYSLDDLAYQIRHEVTKEHLCGYIF